MGSPDHILVDYSCLLKLKRNNPCTTDSKIKKDRMHVISHRPERDGIIFKDAYSFELRKRYEGGLYIDKHKA